jgi:diguanylate cyclase (GGDEF)-like protein
LVVTVPGARQSRGDRHGRYVFALSAALAVIAVFGYVAVVRDASPSPAPFEISWVVLAVAFALSDQFAIHIEGGDDAHSFNLNELPFVLGLFLCDPRSLVLARVIAAVFVLAFVQRQTLVKLVFNVCLAGLESVVVVATFFALRPYVGDGAGAWGVAIGAAAMVTLVQAAAILAAVRLSGGRPEFRHVVRTALLGVVSAAATASLAIAAVAVVEVDRIAGSLIMAVIAAVLFSAYRGYAVVSQRYANVAKLYDFTKSLASSQQLDDALQITVSQACEVLRAEQAELCLLDDSGADDSFLRVRCLNGRIDIRTDRKFADDWMRRQVIARRGGMLVARTTADARARHYLAEANFRDIAMVPLLHADTLIGTLAVFNRRGEVSTFDQSDLTAFETLANHTSVSLENTQLINKLRGELAEKHHQARHDPLTGLGNRSLLSERTDAALAQRRDDELVGVVLMDLNRFKDVNDTLGHQHGDELLREVAARLRASTPRSATITRLGGDEFAVLLPRVADVDDAMTVAIRIQAEMQLPFVIDDLHLAVPGSIGVAMAPVHGTDTDSLLQRADIAMYQAKESDLGVALYDNTQNQHSQRRLTLAAELRTAIETGTLEVHYQPKADLASGRLVGVEALLRWQHPSYGPIAPDEFVPVAERTGLIRPMTLLVLHRALAQLRDWHDRGLEDLHVAVNLSARSLLSAELANDVEAALHAAGVQAHSLTLEVTETQMMADTSHTVAVLDRLAALGVGISVDDFGTGYSSLSYLQRLPVTELKIDKSFVLGLTTTDANLKIVQSIIDLGRNLNLKVIAEGIEDAITWERLCALGCDVGQGFFLSRPIAPARLTPWLLSRCETADGRTDQHIRSLRVVS